ncbi:EAL domain-containing protein [Moorella naiadis]|uniref:EAL domain-containing protein n=1 Tax=Moorella naiadis (nom. illeg.) TaxID=3093670 RepID=UPI003D9CB2BC
MLSENNFKVYYQPIWNLKNKKLLGYEALIRNGSVDIGRLFREASKLGIIDQLDVASFNSIVKAGLPPNGLLFINITASGLPFLSPELARNLTMERMVLEFTEYGYKNIQDLGVILEKWRNKGVKLAVDDLKPGGDQLKLALAIKPDYIKIDRSLVNNCHLQGNKKALLEWIVALCGQLNAEVIAEGIERIEEAGFLVEMDIEYGQGYVLGRPEPAWREENTMTVLVPLAYKIV